jgi:hypothetical protein
MIIEQPRRVRRTYTQNLVAPPAQVFPLLCPVREAEWVPNWDPRRVLSKSGVGEKDCVFVTEAAPQDAVWMITRHDVKAWNLEIIKVTVDHTVCKVEISLTATAAGSEAEISYSYTALSPAGEAFLAEFTADWYQTFMEEWEAAMNHYLSTSTMIQST